MIEIEFFRNVFRNCCSSYSFLTTNGELISVESTTGPEFLSTIQTARFVTKYFPLENGDWVAVNDPQSGGYSPFGISFVGRIENIIWSARVDRPGVWNTQDKWETAGLRLPPLPYKMKGQLNTQIPAVFLDKVTPFEKQISKEYVKLQQFILWKKDRLTDSSLKNYFELSKKTLAEKLSDTPWTEATHKSKTKTGETLSTKVGISGELFSVDLTGTTVSQSYGLTESMTESIITYSCVQALQCQDFYNNGTEKFFQILKPKLSWLSVREPAHPAQVHFLSFPFVESHMKQLLLKMKFPVQNWKCSFDGWMQLQFDDKNAVTTDDLQKNWGQKTAGLKLVRTEENSLVFELKQACKLLRVEGGAFETMELKPGAQFQLELE